MNALAEIADPADNAMVTRFAVPTIRCAGCIAKIEREAGDPAADPKVAAMRKQPRARDDGHRAAEYTKIERSED